MSDNSQDRRKLLIDYISANANDNILEQFFRITKLITDYATLDSSDINPESIEKDEFDSRLNFVNDTYNCMNVINKIIALSVDKRKKPSVIVYNADKEENATEDHSNNITKNAITAANSEDQIKSKRKSKRATKIAVAKAVRKKKISEMIDDDLCCWGIDENSYTYKLIMAMGSIDISKGMKIQSIINAAAEYIGSTPNVASSALASVVKRINIDDTCHAVSIKNTNELTKEALVNAIYNDILLK